MKKIKVLQIKNFETCNYVFRSYDEALNHGFNPKDYEVVYECERENSYSLDDCFYEFNMKRPEDFTGHSLSVSDIVCLDGKYHYCDDCGWKEIDEKTSTLFGVEEYIEKHYTPQVMIVRPGTRKIIIETLKNEKALNYQYMHDVVEGLIEFVHIPLLKEQGIDMICNDEGLLIGLKPSILITDKGRVLQPIVGNVLFVKNKGEDVTGLDEEQIIFLKKLFEISNLAVFEHDGEEEPMLVKHIEWESHETLPQA